MLENIGRFLAMLLGFLSFEKVVDTCSVLHAHDFIFTQALNSFKQFRLHILRVQVVGAGYVNIGYSDASKKGRNVTINMTGSLRTLCH